MNRGTALKVIELIQSGKYQLGAGDLSTFNVGGRRGYSLLGVLADLLDPDGWKLRYIAQSPEPIGYSWHGEAMKLDDDGRKKAKMKTLYGDYQIESNGEIYSIEDCCALDNSWEPVLKIFEQHYEKM